MNRIKLLTMGSMALAINLSTLAYGKTVNQPPTTAWSQHHGTYVGVALGFNLVDFNFYGLNTNNKMVTQELNIGYLFTPHLGIETAIGSYFSGLGLGLRGGAKGVLPITNRLSLSGQIGASYISTFLENGFIGPYLSVGTAFALSPKIEFNVNLSDIITSYALGNTVNVSANFFSALVGFTYHIDL